MTSLMVGSTTEDLMTELNALNISLAGRRRKVLPGRTKTAPSQLVRRNTMSATSALSQSCTALFQEQSTNAAATSNSNSSSASAYNKSGNLIRGARKPIGRSFSGEIPIQTAKMNAVTEETVAPTRRGVKPSRSADVTSLSPTRGGTRPRSRSPTRGVTRSRSGQSSNTAKTASTSSRRTSATTRRSTMGHLGKMVDAMHNSTGNINFNYTEERQSRRKKEHVTSSENKRKQMPKRHHNYSDPVATFHSSFVTGSRIRRIQAGGCGGGSGSGSGSSGLGGSHSSGISATKSRGRTLSPSPRKALAEEEAAANTNTNTTTRRSSSRQQATRSRHHRMPKKTQTQ